MIENSVFLMQAMHARSIERMIEGHAQTVTGHDRVEYGGSDASLTYYRGEQPIARYGYEVLGTLGRETGVFRWGWADRTGILAKRVDAIYREGQTSELSALAIEQHHDVCETDAERLVGLGAHLAGAMGIVRCARGDRVTWLALFEAPRARATPSLRAHAPIQTMPPAAPRGVPSSTPARAVHAPTQERLREVLYAVRDHMRGCFAGFREAMVVVRIDLRQDKARFVVQVSVVDADGALHAPDPSAPVMNACARFIRSDSVAGNGRWRRLLVRLSADFLGANVSELAAE